MSLSLLAATAIAVQAPVLHYLRTNSDGTEAERVIVYAGGPDDVRVFKGRDRCTNAAFVTAKLDPRTGQALSLTGGRLTRELTQQPFAYLTNPEGNLVARLGSRDAAPVFDIAVGRSWFLYDFDFSNWIAHPPAAIREGKDHATDMVLLLTGPGEPTLTNRGRFELTYGGSGTAPDGEFLYYSASGAALDGQRGEMWFGAEDGRLIAARLPLANHAEYRDFAYRLIEREAGEDAWRAVLADHWAGCPAPE